MNINELKQNKQLFQEIAEKDPQKQAVLKKAQPEEINRKFWNAVFTKLKYNKSRLILRNYNFIT